MFRSLRLRMAISHALVLAVLLLVLGGLTQLLLARSLDRGATDELRNAAAGQVQRISEAGAPVAPVDSDIPSSAGIKVAVYKPDGELVGEPAETPSWLQKYPGEVTNLTVDGERVRVVTVPAVIGGQTVAWVATGRSLVTEDSIIHRVRMILLLGGVLAVLASMAAGWWLAGRAVKPVERAYEAQAGFAADASHELRTPLTFIRSAVEVLAVEDPELGGEVLDEVDYLTGLTQRLLFLARAERGSVSFELARLNVGDVCASAARRSERAHGNRITIEDCPRMDAMADSIALEAILDSVLENVKVHGGGSAELSWKAEGHQAAISVVDHGPGIPAEFEDRAFERFFRADPSRTRDTGGAGLGLALARAMAEAQGGEMWVEPTPGGGLTARVALKLAPPAKVEPQPATPTRRSASVEGTK
jgi:two-component system, OmpR family, sensor histidine kinase CiaH